MATIQKRKDSYLIRVSCGYDQNNKQVIKSMTWKPLPGMTERNIQKELKRVALDFESRAQNGDIVANQNLRLAQFIPQYFTLMTARLSPLTQVNYKRIVEDLIVPALGNIKLAQIKPFHIQLFINSLSSKNYKPATVIRYLGVLKSIMACAYKMGLIDKNPTETSRLNLPTIEEANTAIFTQPEAAHMLDCLENEPLNFQVLIHLAIVTGARRGELAALAWDCIDFNAKTITIKQSAYKIKGQDTAIKTTKTNDIRLLAIPDYLMDMLRNLKVEQSKTRLALGTRWRGEGWVFTQWDGTIMYPTTPTLWFSSFLKRNEIPHRKFHALRHSSGTLMLTNGVDIKTVSARLGHKQLSTTNRYLHAIRDADQAAATTLGNILRKTAP